MEGNGMYSDLDILLIYQEKESKIKKDIQKIEYIRRQILSFNYLFYKRI